MRGLVLAFVVACGAPPKKPIAPTPQPTKPVAQQPVAPKPVADPAANPIAAHIGIDIVTIADVDKRVDVESKDVLDQYSDVPTREYYRGKERRRILDEIIDDRLFFAEAKREGMEASDDDITRAIDSVKTANNLTDAQLAEALQRQGFTIATYREDIGKQIKVARYLNLHGKANETETQRKQRLAGELRARTKITITLVEPPPPKALQGKLDASALLTPGDIEYVLKRPAPRYEKLRLDPAEGGQTPSYDTVHLKAIGKIEAFDVALRVWRGNVDEKWKNLDALPNVKRGKELADESLRSQEQNIFGQAFLDRKAGVVVLVTCGAQVCKTAGDALALAKHVHSRLDKLATLAPP